MDSIVSVAIEEICAKGAAGISLTNLWQKLQNSVSSAGLDIVDENVKRVIWNRILNIRGLNFNSKSAVLNSNDDKIQSFVESEKMGLKIVAPKHLRDNFMGLYDLKSGEAGLSDAQLRTLERIAASRENGITQNQLAKEFDTKGNNFFYVVRNLESQRLITRQSTIIRTKKAGIEPENYMENPSSVTTNLIHLRRYAKHLNIGSQQRLEITKADVGGNLDDSNEILVIGSEECGDHDKMDILVKDYLPAMKAICDKLEQSSGKVLVVSDIKQALGYTGAQGHRAWRNIFNRLKDAGLVEEIKAGAKTKAVSCLRLLENFDAKKLQPKNVVSHQDLKYAKRAHITEQVVELPTENQIYDMIDAAGGTGLTVTDICKRIGIRGKRNYNQIFSMITRLKIPHETESHNKTSTYRLWTHRNFALRSTDPFPINSENAVDMVLDDTPLLALEDKCVDESKFDDCSESVEKNHVPVSIVDVPHSLEEVDKSRDTCLTEIHDSVSPSPPKPDPPLRHMCRTLSAVNAQREKLILERLKEEKIILSVELRKWLENLEMKPRMMDKKTLTRTLKKLQDEGLCKCVTISVPALTNIGHNRMAEFVLHPSIGSLNLEMVNQMHEKFRCFDMQSRGRGLSRLKDDKPTLDLTDVERTITYTGLDAKLGRAEAMRANGFVPAKMVRVKLLHIFLWTQLSRSPDWDNAFSVSSNPWVTCKLFSLDVAIRAMPVELFLQVVGSSQNFDSLMESCRKGFTLSDLPTQEYKSLMDTQAMGRLSSIVDVLRRLKLIRLVAEEKSAHPNATLDAVLTHSMELEPYIEEPIFTDQTVMGTNLLDVKPKMVIRHDFVLSKKDAVEAYWKILEYCYSAVNPSTALHAFPGSSVHEVFLARSWSSVRVMTADQRAKLIKRMESEDLRKRISFKDCDSIAKDLNLTLEQVLRYSYDMRQSLEKFRKEEDFNEIEFHLLSSKVTRKRKRTLGVKSTRPQSVNTITQESSRALSFECEGDMRNVDQESDLYSSVNEQNIHSRECNIETLENDEERERYTSSAQCTFSVLKPTQLKYFWSEKCDRELIKQYSRYRAALGARFFRVDWSSIPGLPAPPTTCRRRMSTLNGNTSFRRAVMNLCNLLSRRYSEYLSEGQENGLINVNGSCHQGKSWDDFEDQKVKIAFDRVLRCRRNIKLHLSRRDRLELHKEWSNLTQFSQHALDAKTRMVQKEYNKLVFSSPGEGNSEKMEQQSISDGHSDPEKILNLLHRECQSLEVANAIELLKLVFASNSMDPKVSIMLAELLRCYSESELSAAFNYLKEKKFVVIGNDDLPFILSQTFWRHASSSPFPIDAGKRASCFRKWLCRKENDLMNDGVDLTFDLQCGDLFLLMALVSSGEMMISPCLPNDGVGEADEDRGLKRKSACNISHDLNVSFKQRPHWVDSECCSRREKGFPGIIVSLNRVAISTTQSLDIFNKNQQSYSMDKVNVTTESTNDQELTDVVSNLNSFAHSKSIISKEASIISDNSFWEDMTNHANLLASSRFDSEQVAPLCSKVLVSVHASIHGAGGKGIKMEEICQVDGMKCEKMAEIVVETLQDYGLVLKVNAYDSIRVVEASHGSKYLLRLGGDTRQIFEPESLVKLYMKDLENALMLSQETVKETVAFQRGTNPSICEGHKLKVLNMPDRVNQTFDDISLKGHSSTFIPILPWMNGDGTVNIVLYKGLTRRVLGIVMHNPGILEEDLIYRVDVLNPQSCRKLLELMILDNHLTVRKIHQTSHDSTPSVLRGILGNSFRKPKSVWRNHLFANPQSAILL